MSTGKSVPRKSVPHQSKCGDLINTTFDVSVECYVKCILDRDHEGPHSDGCITWKFNKFERDLAGSSLGEAISKLRKKHGLSRAELAAQVGTFAYVIGHIERGSEASPWILTGISKSLELDPRILDYICLKGSLERWGRENGLDPAQLEPVVYALRGTTLYG